MLKIIKDQQEIAVLDVRRNLLRRRESRGLSEPKGLPDRHVDVAGVVEWCRVDEPDSILERRLDISGCLERQARLPDAAGARQGQ
jgi:hypothetical protein